MGYTHYYSCVKKVSLANELVYQEACSQINKLVYAYAQEHGGIAGFSAHAVPGVYKGVFFNGSRDNGHEPFILRESLALMAGDFQFCKTAHKPYDVLVVAALCILKHYLPGVFDVASDGDYPDWAPGCQLASAHLGFKVGVPVRVRRTSRMHLVDRKSA
jgi:hypothetical protein